MADQYDLWQTSMLWVETSMLRVETSMLWVETLGIPPYYDARVLGPGPGPGTLEAEGRLLGICREDFYIKFGSKNGF